MTMSLPLSLTPPPRTLVSFDIGIKNLAYCYLTDVSGAAPVVHDWRIVDLMSTGDAGPGACLGRAPPPTCTCLLATQRRSAPPKTCTRAAKYTHPATPGVWYCDAHAKSHMTPENGWSFPKRIHGRTKLGGMRLADLNALATQVRPPPLPPGSPTTKAVLVQNLWEHFQKTWFVPAQAVPAAPNANHADVIALGRNLIRRMDALTAAWPHPPTHVLLENQISTMASRMMTIQGEVMMYFLVRFPEAHIEFISSKNKLKFFAEASVPVPVPVQLPGAGTEGTTAKKAQNERYKQHKRDAILYTKQLMDKYAATLGPWEPTLAASKKKDDLCDCFLQAMWYRSNRRA